MKTTQTQHHENQNLCLEFYRFHQYFPVLRMGVQVSSTIVTKTVLKQPFIDLESLTEVGNLTKQFGYLEPNL